ncbi:MAG: DUF952 domain-containing protein [Nocardioidaceae bacterium]
MRIFHLTTPAEWEAAQEKGVYTLSTRGVTLAEEGYIHCSEQEQIEGVRKRSYADVPDVLILVIDTDKLASPWRTEQLSGADQPYPHIYGPLNLDAVVDVRQAQA